MDNCDNGNILCLKSVGISSIWSEYGDLTSKFPIQSRYGKVRIIQDFPCSDHFVFAKIAYQITRENFSHFLPRFLVDINTSEQKPYISQP